MEHWTEQSLSASQGLLIWHAESAHVCCADASSSSLSVQWREPEQDHGSPVTGYLVEYATSSGRGGPAWQKGYSGQDNSCTVSTDLSSLHSLGTRLPLRSVRNSPEGRSCSHCPELCSLLCELCTQCLSNGNAPHSGHVATAVDWHLFVL